MPKRKQIWKSAPARHFLEMAGNPPTIEEAIRIVAEHLMTSVAQAPTDLSALARVVGVANVSMEFDAVEDDALEEDTIHDDGLRFYEDNTPFPIEQRMEQARQIARTFFASMKPRGFTRGVELEKLCERLAQEFVIPTAAFHRAREGKLTVDQIVEIADLFQVNVRLSAKRFMELPFVAIFETSPDSIHWSFGGIRPGRIDMLEPEFRAIVQYAIQSNYEKPIAFFSPKWPWFGSRCVEWRSLNFNKTLFLTRLPRKTERT